MNDARRKFFHGQIILQHFCQRHAAVTPPVHPTAIKIIFFFLLGSVAYCCPFTGHRRHRARAREREARDGRPRRPRYCAERGGRGLNLHPVATLADERDDTEHDRVRGSYFRPYPVRRDFRDTRARGRGRGVVRRRDLVRAPQEGFEVASWDRSRCAGAVRPHRRRLVLLDMMLLACPAVKCAGPGHRSTCQSSW